MASLIPFDDRDGALWLDGALVPWREAQVHVLTHGLHYGSSVFEGERAYGGKAFKMHQHSERLIQSCRLMGMDLPYTAEEIDAATEAAIAAAGGGDLYVRPVAWRGSEVVGVSAQATRIHLAVAAWNWPSYFTPESRMRGIRMNLSRWKRPAPDTAPTQAKAAGLYMISTLAKHEAEDAGYDDTLMLTWQGNLAEASAANLFLVIDGAIHTPTPDCFLNGITRQTIMDLAPRNGFQMIERQIPFADLARADEVFLTGSAAEVVPVREIGEYTFTPGAVCRTMIEAYGRAVSAEDSLDTA